MKKNMLGKILIAVVAALVLSIALIACGGENQGGSGNGSEQQQAGTGVDPMMEYDADGNLVGPGTWNYSDQYIMEGVYGKEPQTNTAIQLICENGKFTCDQPDKGIIPFLDEWEKFMGEGTYTYDGNKVTFSLNGAEYTAEVDTDYGEVVISSNLFDPEGEGVDQDGNSHADMDLTFIQY